jgi:hypothetical protein
MVDVDKVNLPASMGDAVRSEWRRTVRPPYELLVVVGINGLGMCLAWNFLPHRLKDFVFTLHGPLAFALVLASWMFSDVPATNVLGPDRRRVVAAIDDPVMLRRMIIAKNVVLWLAVSPLCAVIAVFIGLFSGDFLGTVYTITWIGVVPFGALGVAAWVGIWFPYHPMPLRDRWQHRRPFGRMIVRWLCCAVTPYVLVPALATAIMGPSLLLWGFVSEHGLTQHLPDHDLGLGVVVACAVAIVCAVCGHQIGVRIVRRRRDALVAFLEDPTIG